MIAHTLALQRKKTNKKGCTQKFAVKRDDTKSFTCVNLRRKYEHQCLVVEEANTLTLAL